MNLCLGRFSPLKEMPTFSDRNDDVGGGFTEDMLAQLYFKRPAILPDQQTAPWGYRQTTVFAIAIRCPTSRCGERASDKTRIIMPYTDPAYNLCLGANVTVFATRAVTSRWPYGHAGGNFHGAILRRRIASRAPHLDVRLVRVQSGSGVGADQFVDFDQFSNRLAR